MNRTIFILFIFINLSAQEVIVGSKKFTESVILGEIITQLLSTEGLNTEHKRQLGGTRVLWKGIQTGDIDIYPDYSGTLTFEIFSDQEIESYSDLQNKLDDKGIGVTQSIGFNNTYAIGMQKAKASAMGIESISDLNDYPDLRIGFTNEFMDRADGWPALREAYNLVHENVTGLDHDLAYKGLAEDKVDVIDLYSTDAEIEYYNIKVLHDDKNHFPDYYAVLLYRKDLIKKYPEVLNNLKKLENSLNEKQIVALNSAVKIDGKSEKEVASSFLEKEFKLKTVYEINTFWSRLLKNTLDHLILVFISLFGAILISIPLGVAAFRNKRIGKVILSVVGIIQTIPSLALLVLMIPLFGIGFQPAVVALFLYSLLPIVRNTYLGFEDIDKSIRESAEVLGLKKRAIFFEIELPIAFRSILSGIKTSGVINVGTATLGALIGAGGYGQPILTGIRLDDMGLILQGAIPAALLAIFVTTLFDLLELVLVPKGIKLESDGV